MLVSATILYITGFSIKYWWYIWQLYIITVLEVDKLPTTFLKSQTYLDWMGLLLGHLVKLFELFTGFTQLF